MTNDSSNRFGVIVIGGYAFEGPVDSPLELRDSPAVYVILDVDEGVYRVIDVGESSVVMSRLKGHNRRVCWQERAKGTLKIAVHYTTPEQPMWRKQLKYELGQLFIPPCQGEE